MKKYTMLTIFGIGILIIIALFSLNRVTPGDKDALAQCIADSDTTFYGAFWCPHCQAQKQLFGKSVKLLPYVECSTPDGKDALQVCKDAGIQSYPTWEFPDGERMTGEVSLEVLAEKTGCTEYLDN